MSPEWGMICFHISKYPSNSSNCWLRFPLSWVPTEILPAVLKTWGGSTPWGCESSSWRSPCCTDSVRLVPGTQNAAWPFFSISALEIFGLVWKKAHQSIFLTFYSAFSQRWNFSTHFVHVDFNFVQVLFTKVLDRVSHGERLKDTYPLKQIEQFSNNNNHYV